MFTLRGSISDLRILDRTLQSNYPVITKVPCCRCWVSGGGGQMSCMQQIPASGNEPISTVRNPPSNCTKTEYLPST